MQTQKETTAMANKPVRHALRGTPMEKYLRNLVMYIAEIDNPQGWNQSAICRHLEAKFNTTVKPYTISKILTDWGIKLPNAQMRSDAIPMDIDKHFRANLERDAPPIQPPRKPPLQSTFNSSAPLLRDSGDQSVSNIISILVDGDEEERKTRALKAIKDGVASIGVALIMVDGLVSDSAAHSIQSAIGNIKTALKEEQEG